MTLFIFFHKENRSAKVIRFCIGTIQVKEFRKKSSLFFGPVFSQKKLSFLNGSRSKLKFPYVFVSLPLIV